MTEGITVLAVALLLVGSAFLYRRWGWAGVAALWGVAVGIVGAVAASLRRRAPAAPPDVSEQRTAIEQHRQTAQKALRKAEEARDKADALRAAVDATDDAQQLVDEGIARALGADRDA